MPIKLFAKIASIYCEEDDENRIKGDNFQQPVTLLVISIDGGMGPLFLGCPTTYRNPNSDSKNQLTIIAGMESLVWD